MKTAPYLLAASLLLAGACSGDDGGGAAEPVTTEQWCRSSERVAADSAAFSTVEFTDPEALRSAAGSLQTTFTEVAGTAPLEIRDDVETMRDSFESFYDVLADAEFRVTEVDPEAFSDFATDSAEAGERLREFDEEHCGLAPVTTPAPTDDDDAAAASGFLDDLDAEALAGLRSDPVALEAFLDSVTEQFADLGFEPDEAVCLATRLDTDGIAAGTWDPSAPEDLGALFDECGIGPERLIQVFGS